MTQKELSEKTGIRQSTISDWKNKGVNPSADKIMIICQVLNMSPEELLTGNDEKYEPVDYMVISKDSEEYSLIEAFRGTDKKQRSRILGYIEALKGLMD